MLYWPWRSPRSFSSRFPGGLLKSSRSNAPSRIASFRLVTEAGGEPRVFPLLQISAVARSAKFLITNSIITLRVTNVNRYYWSAVCHAIFARPVTSSKLYPKTALALLTALNLFNYIDRSVLFAVQDLIKGEFHRSDAAFGLLTSIFFVFYMCAAPFMGPLSVRFSRKRVIVAGALVWSAATLLTAFTKNFDELLIRHTLVGLGEASFVILSPTFVADMFPVEKRGRVMGVFYLAIPVGAALGYLLGGYMGTPYGWRAPFYVCAAPGVLLALSLLFIPEPKLGQFDAPETKSPERNTLKALLHNPAFITATLGMAMMTFALGGLQVWFPTFLHRARGYTLFNANIIFGMSTLINGLVASLAGGWISDWLLRRTK